MNPMLEQPTLGFLMLALDAYGTRLMGWRLRRAPRELRIPCRTLIVCLAEDGPRELTRAEAQLARQAARWYLRVRPELKPWLKPFIES